MNSYNNNLIKNTPDFLYIPPERNQYYGKKMNLQANLLLLIIQMQKDLVGAEKVLMFNN